MKVVVVNDHLYPDGGADTVALLGARALARRGVDVTLFVADRVLDDDTEVRPFRVVCTDQMDLAGDPRRLRVAWQGNWNAHAAHELGRLLEGFDPRDTIVHVHSWTKSLSSSVFAAAHRRGFAVVLTLHDYFSVCPSGTLFNAQTHQNCRLRPMSPACIASHCDFRRYAHKLYRVARHATLQHVAGLQRAVDEFIVISRFSERLIRQHIVDCDRFSLVRNPIDVLERPQRADPAHTRSFVMVGRMFVPKGWDLFLEACWRAGVHALCVGDGPDRARLQQRHPWATFTGLLGRADVTAAMRSARALVMPSIWYETQGLVVAEAASQGVPAIVADLTGAAESVVHEGTGLLVRQGSLDELEDALRRLAGHDALATRLGHAAFDHFWADPPTPDVHARDLVRTYERVLQRRRAGAGFEPAVQGPG